MAARGFVDGEYDKRSQADPELNKRGMIDAELSASGSNQTVSPTAAIASWVCAAAAVLATVTIGASPAIASWTAPAVTLNLTIPTAAASSTWALPTVELNRTVASAPAIASWTAPAVTLNLTIPPASAIATWAVPVTTLNRTVDASAAIGTWTLPAASLGMSIAASPAIATWTAPAVTLNLTIPPAAAIANWIAPTVTLNLTIPPSAASAAWTAPVVTLNLTIPPSAAVATWALPVVELNRTVGSSAAITTWTAPAVTINLTIPTSAAIATWTLPSATASGGTVLSASAAIATWTLPSVTLKLTIPVSPAIATWTAAVPTVLSPVTVAANAAPASWVLPSAVLVRLIVPNAASSSWTLPAATLVPGAVSVAALKAIATWTLPVAGVYATITVNSPSAIAAWTAPAAVITANVTIAPTAIVVGWTLPVINVNGAAIIRARPLKVGPAGYPQVIEADDPEAYFRLDDPQPSPVFIDRTQNHVGTQVGTAAIFGQPGATADGGTASYWIHQSYATLSPSPVFGQEVTYEAWYQPASTVRAPIVSHSGAVLALSEDSGPGSSFVFSTQDPSAGTWSELVGTTLTVQDGRWYHVVAVRDATGRRLYVNGVLDASDSNVTNWPVSSSHWRIGGQRTFVDLAFGFIDELAIYTHVLSAERIAARYAARLLPFASSWMFPAANVSSVPMALTTFFRVDAALRGADLLGDPPYVGQVLTDGAVSHFRMNERVVQRNLADGFVDDVVDFTGAAANPQTSDGFGTTPGPFPGHPLVDTALTFDGNVPALLAADATVWTGTYTTGFTIELWVKSTATGLLLDTRNDPAVADLAITGFTAKVQEDGQFYLFMVSTSGGSALMRSGMPINDGQWHHIAGVLTFSQSPPTFQVVRRLYLYVDGVRVDGDFAIGPAGEIAPSSFLAIGAYPDLTGGFTGAMANVACYHRAFSAAEVAAHFALRTARPSGRLFTVDDGPRFFTVDAVGRFFIAKRTL